MKKYIILSIVLFAFSLILNAQTKKVAVWETKCGDNSITSFQSAMVRGGMETAVANASGYTAYDRTAFDAILKEQNFQRSGAVSDSDIKRLGEMAGVQYIIVPEALAEGNDFYIIVKMLDVETGEYGAAYDALCGTTPTEIKQACSQLGTKLFSGATIGNQGKTLSDNGTLNGHKWVNLGLPSGTLWATCNVGGFSSRDYGDYYSWGETKTKNYYGDENFKYSYGPTEPWGNRTSRAIHYDGDVMAATDDAATVNWGKGWRTPTNEEWAELIDNCTWTKVSNGYNVTGNNGNSIFLPSAGYKAFDRHMTISNGYMSSTKWYEFGFAEIDSTDRIFVSETNPRFGIPVRPVCSSQQ